jgi:anti-sigma-K factor RskA
MTTLGDGCRCDREIINFMAQSFWRNLFIFKSAIAATAITAAKDFAKDEKNMRSAPLLRSLAIALNISLIGSF